MFIGRKCARVHSQGAAQCSHERGRLGLVKFSAVNALIIPRFGVPLQKASQLFVEVGGLVLSGETEILDLTLVRLAQLVDLLARNGVCSADRVGDALQAV